MSYFTGELEPLGTRQLELEAHDLAGEGFTHGIQVAPSFREIRHAGSIVSALAVPNGVETNFQSLFSSAVAHCEKRSAVKFQG